MHLLYLLSMFTWRAILHAANVAGCLRTALLLKTVRHAWVGIYRTVRDGVITLSSCACTLRETGILSQRRINGGFLYGAWRIRIKPTLQQSSAMNRHRRQYRTGLQGAGAALRNKRV